MNRDGAMSEPFYYSPYSVWLLPITPEQADELRFDVQLYWLNSLWKEVGWRIDLDPETWRITTEKPSFWTIHQYAIEVGPPDEP